MSSLSPQDLGQGKGNYLERRSATCPGKSECTDSRRNGALTLGSIFEDRREVTRQTQQREEGYAVAM